jgi:hypothetical protein
MILQGDTVCYEFEVLENGLPLDLTDWDIEAYIKLKYTDSAPVDRFVANKFIGIDGVANGIEVSLTAAQTTCLPITELIYDIEIKHKTLGHVTKIHRGYLNVLPEVTRDATACSLFDLNPATTAAAGAGAGTATSATTGSSSTAALTCPCIDFCITKTTNTAQQTHGFLLETNTEDITLKGFTEWEVEMSINEGLAENLTETELVYNTIDPTAAPSNYDMVYPIGGGKYRFIDKRAFSLGSLVSIFSVPIPIATYQTATFRIKGKTANCESTLQEIVLTASDVQKCFNCQ